LLDSDTEDDPKIRMARLPIAAAKMRDMVQHIPHARGHSVTGKEVSPHRVTPITTGQQSNLSTPAGCSPALRTSFRRELEKMKNRQSGPHRFQASSPIMRSTAYRRSTSMSRAGRSQVVNLRCLTAPPICYAAFFSARRARGRVGFSGTEGTPTDTGRTRGESAFERTLCARRDTCRQRGSGGTGAYRCFRLFQTLTNDSTPLSSRPVIVLNRRSSY
jgi:hypothetical protein